MNVMKIFNHSSIIDATHIKIVEGLRPTRLVLRKNGDEYVTHYECLDAKPNGDTLEFHHSDFFWGNYFKNKEEAEKDFSERSKK